ncbi:dynamin family protein [uncultured Ruminococcus sp.]|uniref:dynamin family protein n=1 Tax=uncultured Ruminococcus sp. TaxID=165186 RepID=UPI0025EF114C|nr:dynamin family protein [uncultured Ruminococcus sp.]
MNYQKFNEKRKELIDIVLGFDHDDLSPNSRECIKRCAEKLRSGKFEISVFGTFSTGKSTLLNAMMQFTDEILVIDELPCTAAVTSLQSPPSPELNNKAEVIFNDETREPLTIPISEIKEYSAKKRENGDITDTTVEDEVKEVKVYVDSPLLQNGIQIIDTPGLNSTYSKHTDITMGILKHSDACLFLFSFEQAGTDKELKFMDLLSANLNKAFLVLNQIDIKFNEIDPDSAINSLCEDLKNKLSSQGVVIGERKIYPISAKYAFQAYCSTEPRVKNEKLSKSRLENLINAIEIYLTGPEFERDKLYVPIQKLEKELNDIREENEKVIQAYNSHANELEDKIFKLKKSIDEENKKINAISTDISKLIKDKFYDLKADLNEKAQDVAVEIADRVKTRSTEYRMKRFLEKGGFAETLYNELMGYWAKQERLLIDKILNGCIDKVDPDEDKEAEMTEWISSIIKLALSFEVVSGVDQFKIDYSEAEELEKKKSDIDKKLRQNAEELSCYKKNSEKRIGLLNERARLEEEKNQIKNSIDMKYVDLSNVRDEIVYQDVYDKVSRDGAIGWCLDKLFGKKTVHKQERIALIQEGDVRRGEIKKDIARKEEEKREADKKLKDLIQSIDELSGSSAKIEIAELERTKLYSLYDKYEKDVQKTKDDAEKEQIAEIQDELRQEIENTVTEFVDTAINKLDEVCKDLRKIAPRVARLGSKEMDNLQKEYDALYDVKASSAEEREKQLTIRVAENKKIDYALSKIEDMVPRKQLV